MKQVCLALSVLFVAAALALTGCGGGGGGGGGGEAATATITGIVQDATAQPIAGATVCVGTATATTGADGKYTLTVTPGAVVVTAENAGCIDSLDVVTVAAGQTVHVDFTMKTVGQSNALTNMTTQQTTATDTRGAEVKLPAGSVVTPAGTPVNSATVEVTTGMPNDANYAENFPGLFVGTQNGADQAIESFGFVTVNITSGGQQCELGQNATADIAIPVAAGADPGTATIDLWSLNQTTGKWVHEGTATRDASGATVVYRATVSHLSTYNLDRAIQAPMPLTVTVSQGETPSTATPVAGASVVVTSKSVDGAQWEGRGVTGADGTCRFASIPQGNVTVKAYKGDLKGNGYGYQVTGGEMSMTVTLVQLVSKTITFVRDVGGVATPVEGASVQAFSEGQGIGGGSSSGTTDAQGRVTIDLATGATFYGVSANATIGGESWYGSATAASIAALPSTITMTRSAAAAGAGSR